MTGCFTVEQWGRVEAVVSGIHKRVKWKRLLATGSKIEAWPYTKFTQDGPRLSVIFRMPVNYSYGPGVVSMLSGLNVVECACYDEFLITQAKIALEYYKENEPDESAHKWGRV